MKETRKGFFERLLNGKENVEAVLKAAEEAVQELDQKGIVRKEGDPVMTLAQNIAAALTAAGVALPDNAVELIAAPIQAAVNQPPAPNEMADMQAKTKEQPAEVEPSQTEQYAALKALAEGQSDYIESTTKDFGEIAKAVVSIAQALGPISTSVQGLDSRMSAIESQLKERPRSASQAAETVVKNTEIEKKIKEGAEPTKTILGIPVKD